MDAAERVITAAIERTEITPYTKSDKVEWQKIEETVSAEYGELGREAVWQSRVLFNANNKQWKMFESNLIPWFEKYGYKRGWVSPNLINGLAWAAFEHIADSSKLASVIKMTNRGLTVDPKLVELIDTHANLLHKLGRTAEAVKWEEKAIELNPNENLFREALIKMKKGLPTWRTID